MAADRSALALESRADGSVRILYMEDDAGLARLFQKHLARAGYEVDLAENGEEGIARYQRGDYDLLAIDYKMPVYNGLEVMNLLAARGDLPPTIMLTANGDEAVAVEALKLGAGDYIVKDSALGYIRLLPSVIDRLLSMHRLEVEQRQAARALEESERRLRAITESASDAILSFDAGGRIHHWNWRAERLFGFRKGGVAEVTEIIPERYRGIYRKEMARLEPYGDPEVHRDAVEIRVVRHDGFEIPAELSLSCWKTGHETFYSAVLRDISDRARTEAALQESARLEATTTLAAGIAHQFNNLLFGVLGNTELLQMRLDDRPDLAARLDMISGQAKKASDLVQQLLAFARRGQYQPVVMSLNQALREAVQSREAAWEPAVRLERRTDPSLWPISADPTQVAQLIMNLVANAVEAMPEPGGAITLKTRNLTLDARKAEKLGLDPGPHVCLTIEDDGAGMSTETLARVYTPFFSTKFQGRGLGMAAVWGIVSHHHGHIEIDSEKGRGTRVKVYLPAVEARERGAGAAPVRGVAPRGNETVLVIDEEDVFLSVTKEYLELLGYRVLLADDGAEALEISSGHRGEIRLVLLETNMSSASSRSVYAKLVEARPDVQVILCSGADLDDGARSLLEAGAAAFLRKPFGLDVLGLEIRRVLDSA